MQKRYTEPIYFLFRKLIPFPLSGRFMIIPVPKKGDLQEVSNYRPISLLCIISKMLESIILKQIISFILPQLSKNHSLVS